MQRKEQTGSTTTKYCIRYLPQKGEFLIGSRNGIFERYYTSYQEFIRKSTQLK